MIQQPLIPTSESDWKPPLASEWPTWPKNGRVAIDVETRDPQLTELGPGVRRGGYIVGVAIGIEDGPCAYLPIRHPEDNVENPDRVWEYLRDQAESFRGSLCGANIGYDLDYLAEAGVTFHPDCTFRDTQVAEALCDDLALTYGLDAVAKRHGLEGKDETLLRDAARDYGVSPKGGIADLPARYVGPYAEQDVRLPLALLRKQEEQIENEGMARLYELECDTIPVLVDMTRRGVRIDTDALDDFEVWALTQRNDYVEQFNELANCNIAPDDLNKNEYIARILTDVGLVLPPTEKEKPSVAAPALATLSHPCLAPLQEAKSYDKAVGTFANSIHEHMTHGRIHPSFNQGKAERDDGKGLKGAVTGRLSSSNPNIQQQPSRHPDIANRWRKIYLAEEGCLFFKNDFSQQEPRIMAHFAAALKRPVLKGALEAAERYRNDPTTDSHSMMAEITGLARGDAKHLYLGRCYGMGALKLCKRLGLPTRWVSDRYGNRYEKAGPEAMKVIAQFDKRAPFVNGLLRACSDAVDRRGYVKTLYGRRCRFKKKADGRYDWTHKALNRIVQGTAAEQTKKAMVLAHRAGYYTQLQVHDEIDGSVESPQEAIALAEIMENCMPELSVPSRVDPEVGPSWGELQAA